MGPKPVGKNKAGDLPVAFEHSLQQERILSGIAAVNAVVCTHDRARMPDLNADLEREQIGRTHGTVADVGGDSVAAAVLIVDGEVLDITDTMLRLETENDMGRHGAGKQRILARVL